MPYLTKLVKRLALGCIIAGPLSSCAVADGAAATEPVVPTPSVASVLVTPDSADLNVGGVRRLIAELRDQNGALMPNEPVTWVSSDPSIISVDSNGTAVALVVGTAEVNARARGIYGRARLRARLEPVASVTVSPSQASLEVSAQIALTAIARSAGDSLLIGRPGTWITSSAAVATVDSLGRVTARGVGSVTISAQVEGRTGVASVTVVAPPPPPPPSAPGTVTSLSVPSVSDTSVALRFTEVADGAGSAANYEIRYSTSAVSFDAATPVTLGSCAGALAGTSVGSTRNCTVLGLSPSSTYRFQVRAFRGTLGSSPVVGAASSALSATTNPAAVASVTLSPNSAAAVVGQTASFAATVRDARGNTLTGRTITWSSSNTAAATVTATGVATAVAAGSAEIRAVAGGITGRATLTVSAPAPVAVASVTVAPATTSLNVGLRAQFTATLRDASGNVLTGRSVSWSSSDSSRAIVSGTGLATAIAAGTATIRATSGGVSGQATMTMTAPAPVATVFQSSWSTGTGNTDNVLTDGGAWDVLACSSHAEVLSVVPGSTVNFTETPNVLRVRMLGTPCGVLQKTAAVPQSTTHYGRFYVRNDETGTRNDHTMAYNNVHQGTGMQAVPFSRYAQDQAPGQWRMHVIIRADYPNNRWTTPPMQNGVWYRYEWQMEFITLTTFRYHIRIYDAAGALLYTEADMRNADGRLTLSTWYDIGGLNRTIELGVLNALTPGPSQARNFGMGNEGPSSGSNTGGYWYYAKVAFSTAGWLGR